jgi:hypothetical protein
MIDLRSIARALGGEVAGAQVVAPGPGHGKRDRSMSVKLSATSSDGFIAFSHSGDDWRDCRDHVRERLGLPPDAWKREPRGAAPTPRRQPVNCDDEPATEHAKARWLWRQRQPIVGSIAEAYLRQARGCGGALPATLGFLPARGEHPPALIAAFGMTTEPEPGKLAIVDDAVTAVQLIKLKPDGSDKADVDPQKIIIGRGSLGSPIVLAPPNDLLGLAISEGLEDALSIHEATGLGAWASGGAGRMPALAATVPSYIDFVTIVPDRDPAGIKGADALADALRRRGIEHEVSFLDGGGQ